jgi:hypothetical protein
MIEKFARNQNWAKITPFIGIVSFVLLFLFIRPTEALFWAYINIPLYLFHQAEEHFWPGGFKDYMNSVIFGLPQGQVSLNDRKVFWINIILVWLAFLVFGLLSLVNIGFGLLIIVFSIMNCITHITQGIKRKEWNPGLVMATIQFLLSLYAAYFVTMTGLKYRIWWWVGTVLFSALLHGMLFRFVMKKK